MATLTESRRNRLRHAHAFMRRNLIWARLYRAASYVKSALWIVPFISIILVLALAPLLRWLDIWLGWQIGGLGVEGMQALCQTVITLALSFMVFTFGSLLVAIQVAGGQLTPRIIATTLLRDNVVRYSVGLFVFALVFTVMALDRLETRVHELVAFIVALLGITCMATFLFLIDYAARLLRPVSILSRVGNEGLSVVESVFPLSVDVHDPVPVGSAGPPGAVRRVVEHSGDSEIVLAVDVESLVLEAQRFDGVIEFVPQVGDFLAHDEPLFALYDGAIAIEARELRAAVAFGPERTMEQDPIFGFRILVDIALKALSPAINDPTTAVLALDQIHRLLRAVGQRQLRREEIVDDAGKVRLIFRTPNWEDFVHVACNEIRCCGAANIQVARRMRAMLENLMTSLPEHRRAALEHELARLDRMLEAFFTIPEDLALARIPDSQGLGGSSKTRSLTSSAG